MSSAPELSSSLVTDSQCCRARVLCLGNDLLADDSFGIVLADQIRSLATAGVEVVSSPETGFHLLDYVSNTRQLVVDDTVMTGKASPGTVLVFVESELQTVSGVSPHYVGLCEVLALARHLSLNVAKRISLVAVEAADCTTVGGVMHPAVRAAIRSVATIVRNLVSEPGESLSPEA